jgi:hypothetical protein
VEKGKGGNMVDNFSKQVAAWRAQHPIAVYLDERGISRSDLAALLNVTRTSVNSWLGGARISGPFLVELRALIPDFDKKVLAWRDASPLNKERVPR